MHVAFFFSSSIICVIIFIKFILNSKLKLNIWKFCFSYQEAQCHISSRNSRQKLRKAFAIWSAVVCVEPETLPEREISLFSPQHLHAYTIFFWFQRVWPWIFPATWSSCSKFSCTCSCSLSCSKLQQCNKISAYYYGFKYDVRYICNSFFYMYFWLFFE